MMRPTRNLTRPYKSYRSLGPPICPPLEFRRRKSSRYVLGVKQAVDLFGGL